MKKLLAILLVVALAFSFAMLNVFATEEDVVVTVGGKASDAYVDVVNNVECENDGDKLVVTTLDSNDPWVSILLDEIDTSEISSFTVKYSIDGTLCGNNVYLKDTEVNTGYSGEIGSWTSPKMDGKTERTFDMASEYSLMVGTKLTGIRFAAGKDPGMTLTIESIAFNKADGEVVAVVPCVISTSRDQLLVDGADRAKIGGNDEVTDVDLTGDVGKELKIWGWLATSSAIKGFGYKINGGDLVTNAEFTAEAGEDVIAAAGASAVGVSRFSIMVPITEGSYKIEAVVETEEASEVIWTVNVNPAPSDQPPTGDVTVSIFAAVVAVAMAATIIFVKKKSF